jgi:predicted Ser/Thr protein kinase
LRTDPENVIRRPYLFAKGDLEVLENVGEGGFGQVFKVKWMGRNYAAKVFKIRGADAGAFNFLYETSVFCQL